MILKHTETTGRSNVKLPLFLIKYYITKTQGGLLMYVIDIIS